MKKLKVNMENLEILRRTTRKRKEVEPYTPPVDQKQKRLTRKYYNLEDVCVHLRDRTWYSMI